MPQLAMFPLGSVLFPHMPMTLRIFEERYVVMLSRLLQEDPSEFGVVLIERGQEVGGGEQRFTTGTVARIIQLEASEGFIGLVAEGGERLTVTEWLAEEPHPAASVERLPDLEWDVTAAELLEEAERVVRRALSRASEFVDGVWAADVALASEPLARAWQLAGVAPLGQLDQITLLRSTSLRQLLEQLIELTEAAESTLEVGWSEAEDDEEA